MRLILPIAAASFCLLQASCSARNAPPARHRSDRAGPQETNAPPTTGRQPVPDPPEPPQNAADLPPGAALGMPRDLSPGAPAAYWIWQDPQGGWHLRTTTAGNPHDFGGRILGVSGEILGAKPMRTEHRDRLRYSRRGLIFDFHTQGSIDGIDFHASDKGCVRFVLRLDRGPAPKRIFIGQGGAEPPHSHFVLCPSG